MCVSIDVYLMLVKKLLYFEKNEYCRIICVISKLFLFNSTYAMTPSIQKGRIDTNLLTCRHSKKACTMTHLLATFISGIQRWSSWDPCDFGWVKNGHFKSLQPQAIPHDQQCAPSVVLKMIQYYNMVVQNPEYVGRTHHIQNFSFMHLNRITVSQSIWLLNPFLH